MGNPQHFSLELPQRCLQLLNDLYLDLPVAESCGQTPLKLKATFLLAISMPMINLPLERINKYRDDGHTNVHPVGHMNDAPLNEGLGKAIKKAIDPEIALKAAPFFKSGAWRYHKLPKENGFPNLAKVGLPQAIAQQLREDKSDAGSLISTKLFCDILRNSLAHGGVLFLNEHGESADRDPVRMFAFVSTNRMNNPDALHILRIGMKEYRTFLGSWANWLKRSGLQKDLGRDVGTELSAVAISGIEDAILGPTSAIA